MSNEPSAPDDILLDFLERLPITIKDSVLYMCCFGMGIFDLTILAGGNLIEPLREILDAPQRSAAYACARLIGVLELVLERDEDAIEDRNWELYQETGVETFRGIAMRQPFEQRHWRVAREEFYKLRQGALSSAALHRWQWLPQASSPDEQENE